MATEKRLISLDEAINATHEEVFWTESEAAAVRSFLAKRPKVDAVEVVHCKDCFANGCCSVQDALEMGDEGYCPKGRKERQ